MSNFSKAMEHVSYRLNILRSAGINHRELIGSNITWGYTRGGALPAAFIELPHCAY
jgi:hypothetical protein